ncbi:MAG TPA: DUF4956 domain-containing protein [Gemmatimonadaceae bacterium]
MATGSNGSSAAPATRVLIGTLIYYAVLAFAGIVVLRYLPRTRMITATSLDALFGAATETVRAGNRVVAAPVDQGTLAATEMLAMLSAALLALPVAWIYTLTRARRGYQQSVVQLLLVLPVGVAGIVVLVKYSITLAFGLGGIAAAVRFRNSLEDSKDAVYVFLVTGIGIAAAVDLPVALVMSFMINVIVVALWMTDFGRTPVALEGKIADRRLQRARQLARTGTFVARIDDEVLRDMTAEQLEGVAQRAWRRAREHNPEGEEGGGARPEALIRLKTRNPEGVRPLVEERLEESAKKWRLKSVFPEGDVTVVEYTVTAKKSKNLDDVLSGVRAAGGAELLSAELQ